ncbi:MAG: hypothetical protein AB7G13_32945 [Lautropia sp.]
MSFLLLLIVASALAYVPQFFAGDRRDLRMAMRHGMALALLFTGADHFANDTSRYLPMMPAFFGSAALPLVWITGAAEIAGAIGLAMPLAAWRRLGLPNLRPVAGVALAVLFALLVIANINMAIQGTDVRGLEFGRTYLIVRPLLQPLFMLWALYAAGVIGRGSRAGPIERRPSAANAR